MTWITQEVNRIPTYCCVAYESDHSRGRGHVKSVWLGATHILGNNCFAHIYTYLLWKGKLSPHIHNITWYMPNVYSLVLALQWRVPNVVHL